MGYLRRVRSVLCETDGHLEGETVDRSEYELPSGANGQRNPCACQPGAHGEHRCVLMSCQRPKKFSQLEACGPLKPAARQRVGKELLACIELGSAVAKSATEVCAPVVHG